jgi:glycosyltransferase involved in cell wall biosynthesis
MNAKKIRLLFLLKSLNIGGVERSTINYANQLSDKIDFVGIFGSEGFYDHESLIKETVVRFIHNNNYRINFFNSIAVFLKIIHIINEYQITHIHYNQRNYSLYVFLLKRIYRKVKVIYSHQNIFNDIKNYLINADKIIALTKAAKNDLPKHLKKITTVIPHGTFISEQSFTKRTNVNFIFGYVGRFIKWKGVLELMDDFIEISNFVQNSELHLYGTGPLLNDIKIKIQNSTNKRIFIHKPLSDLSKIYKEIDVLILPSKKLEGFGLVLAEAMSFGIPVIAHDNSVFNETIIHGVNGLKADGKLTPLMLEISRDKELYKRLSDNARKKSLQYDIKKIISRYINEVYESI